MKEILVARNNHHLMALRRHAPGSRGDKVIRLLISLLQGQHTEGSHSLADIAQLLGQIFRHGRPVGLVVFVEQMPEDRPLGIKGHSHIGWRPLLDQAAQNGGKAVDRVGGQAG